MKRRYGMIFLLGFFGIVLSFALFFFGRELEQKHIEVKFTENIAPLVTTLKVEIARNIELVELIGGFFDGSREVTRQEFSVFVERPMFFHDDIQALEWIPRVSDKARAAFEAKARSEWLSEFQFTERQAQGLMERAGSRSEYFPVYYVEPLMGNESAVGFDIASETHRKNIIEKARDMNTTIVTGGITLVQETREQYGFLIVRPVYRKGTLPETIEQRREHLIGYALGVFRIGDMVERAWKEFTDMNLDARIYDQGKELFFSHGQVATTLDNTPQASNSIQRKIMIDLPGRQWALVFTATPEYVKTHAINRALPGLLIGFVMTALLLLYLYTNIRYNIRLESNITERKQAEDEIKQKNENLATLQKVSQALNASLNSEAVNQIIVENATWLLGLDTGAIYQINEGKLILMATIPPLPPDFPDELRQAILTDHPHIQKTVSTLSPIVLEDIAEAVLSPAERTIAETRSLRSILYLPLIDGKKVLGVMILGTTNETRTFSEAEINLYRTFSAQATLNLKNSMLFQNVQTELSERKKAEKALQKSEEKIKNAFDKIKQLRDKLQAENIVLRKKIKPTVLHKDFIGESTIIQNVINKAIQVANKNTTVLLYGETGTGKELLARGIHNASKRKDNTLVTINCAAIPETLVESELFGSEKGAYTDSKSKKIGIFEIADKSTLLLDEVGELPLATQSKLLRVIENREIIRVGGNKPIKVDVRIIAATNQKLETLIKKKKFRQDLYYRLNVYPIELPPLRNRVDDIPLLTEKFVEDFNNQMGKTVETISKKDIEKLKKYSWPGNARELKNIIERSMISAIGKKLIIDIPDSIDNDTSKITNLKDLERNHILSTLERTFWKISGKGGAAEILGLHHNTLNARIKKLGIKRPK